MLLLLTCEPADLSTGMLWVLCPFPRKSLLLESGPLRMASSTRSRKPFIVLSLVSLFSLLGRSDPMSGRSPLVAKLIKKTVTHKWLKLREPEKYPKRATSPGLHTGQTEDGIDANAVRVR